MMNPGFQPHHLGPPPRRQMMTSSAPDQHHEQGQGPHPSNLTNMPGPPGGGQQGMFPGQGMQGPGMVPGGGPPGIGQGPPRPPGMGMAPIGMLGPQGGPGGPPQGGPPNMQGGPMNNMNGGGPQAPQMLPPGFGRGGPGGGMGQSPPGQGRGPPGFGGPGNSMNNGPGGPLMNMNGPGMNGPGMNGPGMNGPGMNGPGMNGPGMKGPGMNGPGMNGPGMNGPGMNGPGMNGQHGPGGNNMWQSQPNAQGPPNGQNGGFQRQMGPGGRGQRFQNSGWDVDPNNNFDDPKFNNYSSNDGRPAVRFKDGPTLTRVQAHSPEIVTSPMGGMGESRNGMVRSGSLINLYNSTDGGPNMDRGNNISLYASADGVLENRMERSGSPRNYDASGYDQSYSLQGGSSFQQKQGREVERASMRAEADKIAERLLKTEEELDRLRRQGQLIGESLRRQKSLEDGGPVRSPLAPKNGSPFTPTRTGQLGTFGATMPSSHQSDSLATSSPLPASMANSTNFNKSSFGSTSPSSLGGNKTSANTIAAQSPTGQNSKNLRVGVPQSPSAQQNQWPAPTPGVLQRGSSPTNAPNTLGLPTGASANILNSPTNRLSPTGTAVRASLSDTTTTSISSITISAESRTPPTQSGTVSVPAKPAKPDSPTTEKIVIPPPVMPRPFKPSAAPAQGAAPPEPPKLNASPQPVTATKKPADAAPSSAGKSPPAIPQAVLEVFNGEAAKPPPPLPGHVALGGRKKLETPEMEEKLEQATLNEKQCEVLGLPPGTIWFDGSDAQMKLIEEQLKASEAEKKAQAGAPPNLPRGGALPPGMMPPGGMPPPGMMPPGGMPPGAKPPPPAPEVPKTSGKTAHVPNIDDLSDDDFTTHFLALNLNEASATVADVTRAYKRLISKHLADVKETGDFTNLLEFTTSFKICEGLCNSWKVEVGGELKAIGEEDEEEDEDEEGEGKKTPTTSPSKKPNTALDVDPYEVYHKVVFHKLKHSELKVELGVAIEDLVKGNSLTFEFDRMIYNDDGKKAEERCQLQINVQPGMRAWTQFIFECEGDEAPGVIPSDVCVTLVLEPHQRFFAMGDDLATEVFISLADAVLGAPVIIHTVDNAALELKLPQDLVYKPEAVFKCQGEGLPLPHDPSQRGDLFVKVHVMFPDSAQFTKEQADTIRAVLTSGPLFMPPSVHDKMKGKTPARKAEMVPSNETQFGASSPEDGPLMCAQQ